MLFMIVMLVAIITFSLAAAEVPSSYYEAVAKMKNIDALCVKNYDAGASLAEAYTDFQYLNKNTEITSTSSENLTGSAVLGARLDSEVIGSAQLVWQSLVLSPDITGRHVVLSRNEENLTGVFSVEKLIQLSSNYTIGGRGLEWLPCG